MDDESLKLLIGLTEKEAVAKLEKADVDYRILTEGAACVCEYSAGRVTVKLKNGKVARAYLG